MKVRRPTKTVGALFAVLTAALLLAGACSSTTTETGGGSGGTSGPAGSGAGGSGVAATGEPVKVGAVTSLSGPAAEIGKQQVLGLEVARDELNANGGILGRPIELMVKDDGGDPTKAAQVMRELVDQEEVKLVFGPTLSSPTLAAAPVAMEAGVIEFSTSVAPELGDPTQFPYFFRVSPSAVLQAETFVKYIGDSGQTKVALIAVNNALGSSNVEAFNKEIEGTDIQVVATEFHESGAVDVSTQVGNAERAGADVVVVLSTAPPDQVAVVKARNQIDWDVAMLGFSTMGGPLVVEGVGVEGMDKVYAGQVAKNFTGTPPAQTAALMDVLRTKLGEPTLTRDVTQAAVGFDSLQMMAAGVNSAGTLDDPDAIAAAIVAASPCTQCTSFAFEYTEESHGGAPLSSLVFVQAAGFDDGVYQLAPNQ